MFNSNQFFKYRFLIVIIAVLVVSTAFCLLITFVYKNGATTLPNQIPISDSDFIVPTIVQTATFLQIDQVESPTPFSPQIPIASSIPTLPVWSPLHPISDDNRGLLTNGNRSEQKVSLTFDVCQREGDLAGYDAEIVRILSETQTPATFFLGGLWMRDHQAETLVLANNPLFELGNHSWSHLDFSVITPEEMDKEILLTQQYMFELLGYQTNLFRLPYGTYNETSLNVIGENGLYTIQWDVVSGDPDPNINADSMTKWVLHQVNSGSIIIMHANGRGWHTAEALPVIIQTLRQNGYTLVTVSELLSIE